MARPLSNTPIHPTVMSEAEGDKIVARVAIAEAKNGNPWPLISRLRANQLTEAELNYISEFGIRHGERGHAEIRRARDALVRMQVKWLRDEGMKKEAAVEAVARSAVSNAAPFSTS